MSNEILTAAREKVRDPGTWPYVVVSAAVVASIMAVLAIAHVGDAEVQRACMDKVERPSVEPGAPGYADAWLAYTNHVKVCLEDE